MNRLVRISKLMSLILRHEPERFGVTLDGEGFATVDEVFEAIRTKLPDAKRSELHAVVETVDPQKQRFTIDGDEIRANYGHSLAERIDHAKAEPPQTLYHGTHEKALPAILSGGLRPMARQYVHLTTDIEIARRVGGRRGKPRLVEVAAARAHEAGVAFHRANRTFWLVDAVEPDYLSVVL